MKKLCDLCIKMMRSESVSNLIYIEGRKMVQIINYIIESKKYSITRNGDGCYTLVVSEGGFEIRFLSNCLHLNSFSSDIFGVHFYIDEKKVEDLKFLRKILEEKPKIFNLTEKPIAIIDDNLNIIDYLKPFKDAIPIDSGNRKLIVNNDTANKRSRNFYTYINETPSSLNLDKNVIYTKKIVKL